MIVTLEGWDGFEFVISDDGHEVRVRAPRRIGKTTLRMVPWPQVFRVVNDATSQARITALANAAVVHPLPKGSIPDDESLIGLYRSAITKDVTPTKVIGQAFGVSQATASRWLTALRRRGLIGTFSREQDRAMSTTAFQNPSHVP